MKKRLISWITVLAVTLMQLMPSVSLIVYAAGLEASASLSSAEGKPGDTVALDLMLDSNPGLDSMVIYFEYDTNILECVSIDEKEMFGVSTATNMIFSNSGLSSEKVKLNWIPDERIYATGLLASINFKIKNDAVSGNYEIKLTTDGSDNFQYEVSGNDVNFTDVDLKLTSGSINVSGNELLAQIKDRTSNGFTIEAMEGYTYYVSDEDSIPDDAVWSSLDDDVKIDGLDPNTIKYVFVSKGNYVSKSVAVRVYNNNASLSSLELSNGTLTPSFSTDVTDYTVKIPYGGDIPTVNATAKDENAKVEINQAENFENSNVATVVVTAENGIDQKTYKIAFSEINATLSDLYINGDTVQGFSPSNTAYTYEITYESWNNNKNATYTVSAVSSTSDAVIDISDNTFAIDEADADTGSKKIVTIKVTTADAEVEYTITFKVAPCTHSNTKTETIDPTCLELGKKSTICTICGKIIEAEDIAALGHNYDSKSNIKTEPTCTNEGITVYTCTRCGYELERKISPLGHVWSEDWTIEKEATCTEDGEKHIHCVKCNISVVTEVIPALGHNWENWQKVDETTYKRSCSVCGKTDQITVAPSQDHEHDFSIVTGGTDPTCTSDGSRILKCSYDSCNETITETLSMIAHTEGDLVETPASCTSDGSSKIYCVNCNKLISSRIISATGHSFTKYTDTATCTDSGLRTAICDNGCNTVDIEPTYAKGHSYGDFKPCNSDASLGHWKTCSVCGYTSDIVSHNSDGGVVEKPATETETGLRIYTCVDCGYVIKTEEIPKLVATHTHKYSTTWSSNSNGHWHECECGAAIDYASHVSDGGLVTTYPTDTSFGIRTYSCKICKYIMYTETISATVNNGEIDYYPTIVPSVPTSTNKNNIPYIQGDKTKSGWTEITSELKSAKEKRTVTVMMNGSTSIPKEALQAIQNRNIILVLDMGNKIEWKISGIDITNPKEVDMGVTLSKKNISSDIRNSIGEVDDLYSLTISYDGNFGFTAYLTVNLGMKYDDYIASLYYCNDSNQFYSIAEDTVSDGNVTFAFTHASDYIIALNNNSYEDVSASASITADPISIDFGMPVVDGVQIPAAVLPKRMHFSNKKRRYRILSKRELDDLVFVF